MLTSAMRALFFLVVSFGSGEKPNTLTHVQTQARDSRARVRVT